MKKTVLLLALLTGLLAFSQPQRTDCSQIKSEKGRTETQTVFTTPFVDGISLKKIKDTEVDTYIVTVRVLSPTKQSGSLVELLFEDGNVISKNDAKVLDGPVEDGKYQYYALILLDDIDTEYLKNSEITGIQVMNVMELPRNAKALQELAGCLILK